MNAVLCLLCASILDWRPRPAYKAEASAMTSWVLISIVIISAVFLAGSGILWQDRYLAPPYLEGEQLARHRNVLAGTAPDPWRYRVLAEWVAAGFVKAAHMLPVSRPVATGFRGLRVVQHILIFGLAFAYYRRLGINSRQALVGVMVLAFVFTHAIDNSDLSFNTYFDVMFYLAASLAVLSYRTRSFLVIVIAAALNRETSGLTPLLPVAEWAAQPPAWPADWRRHACVSACALIIWLVIFIGLRVWLGAPSRAWEEQWGYSQGLTLVKMNLSSRHTLMFLALTLSILPILTVWQNRAPSRLHQGPILVSGAALVCGPPVDGACE